MCSSKQLNKRSNQFHPKKKVEITKTLTQHTRSKTNLKWCVFVELKLNDKKSKQTRYTKLKVQDNEQLTKEDEKVNSGNIYMNKH